MAKVIANKGPESVDTDKTNSSLNSTEAIFARNKNIFLYVGLALALVIGGFVFYKYQQKQKNAEAQAEMFQSVYAFEADSLDAALKGGAGAPGLVDIAGEYSGTKAGDLASFYVGVAYLKKGKYDEAIDYLKEFNAKDLLVQARAYSLIGDAYMEKKEYGEAVEYYSKAANYKPNEQFTPRYLVRLALAHELNKDADAAAKQYDIILEKYPKAMEATEAKKEKARLKALASE